MIQTSYSYPKEEEEAIDHQSVTPSFKWKDFYKDVHLRTTKGILVPCIYKRSYSVKIVLINVWQLIAHQAYNTGLTKTCIIWHLLHN